MEIVSFENVGELIGTKPKKIVEQAGGVMYREEGGGIQVFTVRSKAFPEQRIFPKGHIETGETPEETAVREMCEEGGMIGEVVGYAGLREFDFGKKRYRVRYYAMRCISKDNEGEPGRDPLWAPVPEVRAFLPYQDLVDILDNAMELIKG